MRRAIAILASSLAAACAGSAPSTFECVRSGETVFRAPAPGASVTDDGLLVRMPDGSWRFVEADRCWRVR